MPTTAEHAMRITTTNTGAFVPVCSCGWIGTLHLVPVTVDAKKKKKRHPVLAENAAKAEANTHAYVLDPGVPMAEFRCEVCRREFTMARGSTTCPHDGGTLSLRRGAL